MPSWTDQPDTCRADLTPAARKPPPGLGRMCCRAAAAWSTCVRVPVRMGMRGRCNWYGAASRTTHEYCPLRSTGAPPADAALHSSNVNQAPIVWAVSGRVLRPLSRAQRDDPCVHECAAVPVAGPRPDSSLRTAPPPPHPPPGCTSAWRRIDALAPLARHGGAVHVHVCGAAHVYMCGVDIGAPLHAAPPHPAHHPQRDCAHTHQDKEGLWGKRCGWLPLALAGAGAARPGVHHAPHCSCVRRCGGIQRFALCLWVTAPRRATLSRRMRPSRRCPLCCPPSPTTNTTGQPTITHHALCCGHFLSLPLSLFLSPS